MVDFSSDSVASGGGALAVGVGGGCGCGCGCGAAVAVAEFAAGISLGPYFDRNMNRTVKKKG